MDNIYNMLIEDGVVYNTPKEKCVRYVKHYPNDGVYRIVSYSYDTIIDLYHSSITEQEFVSRLVLRPTHIVEYGRNSEQYKYIQAIIDAGRILPELIGLSRCALYSLASSSSEIRKCEDCLHCSQCKSMSLSKGVLNDPEKCNFFLNVNTIYSEATKNILRQHYINEIAKFACYDHFVLYMQTMGITTALLKSLDVNHIVFVTSGGRYGNRSCITKAFATAEEAKAYIQLIVQEQKNNSNIYGYPETWKLNTDDNITQTCYRSRYGEQTTLCQFISL